MSDTARKEQKRQTWDSSYTVLAGSRSLPGLRKQALKTWLASTRVAIAQRLFYIYIYTFYLHRNFLPEGQGCLPCLLHTNLFLPCFVYPPCLSPKASLGKPEQKVAGTWPLSLPPRAPHQSEGPSLSLAYHTQSGKDACHLP